MSVAAALHAGFTDNPRTRALHDGRVRVEGLDVTAVGPGDLFFRQLKNGEFDVSELSVASYAIAVARGDERWVALPVFTTREVFHAGILVRDDSAVRTPSDLRGKRVGVLEYQQTSVVWIRGVLQHVYGIAPHELDWYMERRPEYSHGGSTGFVPPAGVRLTYVDADTSLATLLHAGAIDAILFYPPEVDAIDRRPGADRSALRARTLFPEPAAESAHFVATMGFVPINHAVVVRRTVLRERPELARTVFDGFLRARDAVTTADAFPYGLRANERALATLVQYLAEQQLTPRRLALDELFLPESREWPQ